MSCGSFFELQGLKIAGLLFFSGLEKKKQIESQKGFLYFSNFLWCPSLLPSADTFTDFLPYALDLFGVYFQEKWSGKKHLFMHFLFFCLFDFISKLGHQFSAWIFNVEVLKKLIKSRLLFFLFQ
jgi:hypothetical protein